MNDLHHLLGFKTVFMLLLNCDPKKWNRAKICFCCFYGALASKRGLNNDITL